MTIINHQFLNKPFFIPNWEIKHLFLGTFNPEGGKPVAYFYGRPRNFTWQILSEKFEENFNREKINELLPKLQKNKIACMDMIRSIEVRDNSIESILGKGYSDVKIINNKVLREYNTTFINEVIQKNPNITVYSTWGNGSTLSEWLSELKKINSNIKQLVSPSPAARVEEGVKKYDNTYKNWSNLIEI